MTSGTGCSTSAAKGRSRTTHKSFILESKVPKIPEVEHTPSELPFEIQLPEASEIMAGPATHEFNATLTKSTIAAKRMLWLWRGEVAGSGRRSRVLGTTQSGKFGVSAGLAASYPATLSVRVTVALTARDGSSRRFGRMR